MGRERILVVGIQIRAVERMAMIRNLGFEVVRHPDYWQTLAEAELVRHPDYLRTVVEVVHHPDYLRTAAEVVRQPDYCEYYYLRTVAEEDSR